MTDSFSFVKLAFPAGLRYSLTGAGLGKRMRRRAEGKLEAVADAALEAFTDHGFQLTQMSEIARRAGISAGTLYLYVEDKEAMLRVAALHAAGQLDPQLALPIQAASVETVLGSIERALVGAKPWGHLTAALEAPGAEPLPEVGAIVDELFDLLYRNRRVIMLLSRCSRDLPALAEAYDRRLRSPYVEDLARYLAAGVAAGRLRGIAKPLATARGIVELASWMAMNRTRHPAPTGISTDEAKQATRDLVLGGICGVVGG